jgi:hypothetical protein
MECRVAFLETIVASEWRVILGAIRTKYMYGMATNRQLDGRPYAVRRRLEAVMNGGYKPWTIRQKAYRATIKRR